jgi:hypothetical protein
LKFLFKNLSLKKINNNKMIEYNHEIIDFYQRHGKKLPSLQTGIGIALAWLSQPDMRGGKYWVDRDMAERFFKERGYTSSDVIQAFNKPGGSTPGLKLDKSKGRGKYSLKYPFEFNDMEKRDNVKMNVLINGTKLEQVMYVKKFHYNKLQKNMKDAQIFLNSLKVMYCNDVYDRLMDEISHIKWNIEHIIDQPVREWHIGHLDATNGNDPANLYYQPPIQARFRDKYIFNRAFERIRVKV